MTVPVRDALSIRREHAAIFGERESGVHQLVAALVHYSRQLATSKIYLDPRDDRADGQVSAFCSECLRGGVNGNALDHAPSCVAGRVLELIADIDKVSAPPQTPNERTDANHSDALTEQEDGSAEGQARDSFSDLRAGLDRIWPVGGRPLVEGHRERTIEYFPERHYGELDLPGDGATA